MGFSPFRGSFVLMYMHLKAPLFPVNTIFLAPPYIIHKALLTHVDFFCLCPSSSVDINTQYVTAGYAPNAPAVLISTTCESVILL